MSEECEATLLSLGFNNRCFTSGGELIRRLKVQAEGPECASFGLVLHLRPVRQGDPNYSTAGIALRILRTLKPHHTVDTFGKVEALRSRINL